MRRQFRRRWTIAVVAIAVVAIAVIAIAGACGHRESADLIIHGGPILTVDSLDRVAEAVAIRDGRIIAVGSEAQVMGLRSTRTEVRDLKGQALLPGFVAAHEHPTINAIFGIGGSGATHHSQSLHPWFMYIPGVRVVMPSTPYDLKGLLAGGPTEAGTIQPPTQSCDEVYGAP